MFHTRSPINSAAMSASLPAAVAPSLASRANVDELITKHRADIDKLRAATGEAVASFPALFDDIGLLRYVLSNDDHAEAVDAVKATAKLRREKGPLLAHASEGREWPLRATIAKFCITHVYICADGSPLTVVRAGVSNPAGLLDTVSEDDVLDWMLLEREEVFLICDAKTRETRMLYKNISVVDLNGAGMSSFSRQFGKILGRASKISEQVYPQLLEKSVMINLPALFNFFFRVFKTFMSKRSLEKASVCLGKTDEGSIENCPFVKRRMNPADIPRFLGGSRPVSSPPVSGTRSTPARVLAIRSGGKDPGNIGSLMGFITEVDEAGSPAAEQPPSPSKSEQVGAGAGAGAGSSIAATA